MGLVGVWTGFLDGVDFVHDSREAWWGSEEVFEGSDINGGVKYRERSSSG